MNNVRVLVFALLMTAGASFRANGQIVMKNDTIQCASHSQSIN